MCGDKSRERKKGRKIVMLLLLLFTQSTAPEGNDFFNFFLLHIHSLSHSDDHHREIKQNCVKDVIETTPTRRAF
jgi:hypothetical protein